MKSAKPILALLGYGRMGREVETAGREAGFEIPVIIDEPGNTASHVFSTTDVSSVDVCIDFTTPGAVTDNVTACAAAGKNIVIGTTGWENQFDAVSGIVEKYGVGLIYAANFSVGVHIFSRIVRYSSILLRSYEQYDIAIQETHHTAKKDSPSGTALWLAKGILDVLPRKSVITTERTQGAPRMNELHISSSRVGFTPGEHEVVLDSLVDTISLRHTARGRQGFAQGALLAAGWIHGKKGIFSIEDMFDDIETH